MTPETKLVAIFMPPVWIRLGCPLRTLADAFLRPRRPL
jgi:hypothetical protein